MGWLDEAAKKYNPVKTVTNPVKTVVAPIKSAMKIGTSPVPVKAAINTVVKPVQNVVKQVAAVSAKADPTGMVRGINKGVSQLGTGKSFKSNLAGFADNAMGGDIGRRIFGSRGPGERLGVTPTTGPYANKPQAQQSGPGQMGLTGFGKDEIVTGSNYQSNYQPDFAPEMNPTDAIGRRYTALQSNLKAREGAASQGEQDALNRRFASMGMGKSGAAMRASSLSSDAANRRMGEQRNALYASQAGDEMQATEAANARNLQRAGLGMESEKMKQDSFFRGKELDLNQKVAYNNMEIAKEELKRNNEGFINGLFGDIFGRGYSMKTPLGPFGG